MTFRINYCNFKSMERNDGDIVQAGDFFGNTQCHATSPNFLFSSPKKSLIRLASRAYRTFSNFVWLSKTKLT